jgi:hypothetical protein
MRLLLLASLSGVVLWTTIALAADPLPALADPVQIMADGKPIAADIGHLSPCVIDINHDGKKDLLVGQFSGGRLRVYLNQGSDADPKFGGFSFLKAEGAEATVPPS